MTSKVLVGLPAYNEGPVIADVILGVKARGYKNIVVCDDCSLDDTSLKAKKSGAVVLRHVINRGAGAANMTLIEYAKEQGFDHLVIMDADGQHSAEDIDRLMKYSHKFDVVMGSRLIALKDMPFIKKVANKIGSFLTYLFFGLYVQDSQSGFKVFNKNALHLIEINYDRYEYCSEIVGEIKKHDLSYKEVPIKVIYTDHSKSKGQNIKEGFLMILRFFAGGNR